MRKTLITLTVLAIVTVVAVFVGSQMYYEQAIKERAAAVEQYKASVAILRANIVEADRQIWIGDSLKGRVDLERNTVELGRLLVAAKARTFHQYLAPIQPAEIGIELESEAAKAIRVAEANKR